MSLVFSGGTIVDTTFNLGTTAKKKALYDGVITALTSAGWTISNSLPNQTYTTDNSGANIPNDSDSITMLGKTYTWKTAINNLNDGEVLIGADGDESFDNLVAAVNLAAGSGTTYSSATTAGDGTITSTDITGASDDSFVFTADSADDAAGSVSDSYANGAWDSATLSEDITYCDSAETADYLTARIGLLYDGESNDVIWLVYNRDRSDSESILQTQYFTYTDNADQRIVASKYNFWCFKPGGTSDFTTFAVNVLSVPEPLRAKKITAATNATPIAITTNVPHGYTTGWEVKQQYVEGNTAANGTFTITVTGPSTYTLNGSVGNGAMTGSLGMAACITSGHKEIFEYTHTFSCIFSGGGNNFRETLIFDGDHAGAFNGVMYPFNTDWWCLAKTVAQEDSAIWPWFNDAVALEPPVSYYSADDAATWSLAGQFYNTAIVRQSTAMDQPVTDAAGNSWVTLTNNYSLGTFMIQVA